jgi:poly-gamma-glutamate synthesis protein (capsule biosynthesis protein)
MPSLKGEGERGTEMALSRRAAILALLAMLIPGPAWAESRFSLIAAGDALIHRGVYNAAALKKGGYDFRPMLRFIKSRTAAHDIAFYNQETILGGVKLGLSTYPCFNSPREVGDAFLDAGFNLVSLANNHTLDRGEKGVLASLEYWEDKNRAVTAGSCADKEAGEEVSLFEAGGITCAFMAYTTATNGLKAPGGKEYYVSLYSFERAKADVEKARKKKADAVIVSMHWGAEYVFDPTAEQKKIAAELASLGVNLVIGHHPHVVQPVAMVKDTLVIYSLGNFISAQKELYKLIGLMVSMDVVKREKDGRIDIAFENVTGMLTYNPRNSVLGRYVIVPFDMMTEAVLKNYPEVYKKYAAVVKGKGEWQIAMRPAAPLPRKAKK